MKLLHDFNYEELHECLVDLYRDVQIYSVFVHGLNHQGEFKDSQGLICLANDLESQFQQHVLDFDMIFDRINRGAVPEEEEEPAYLLLKRKNF